MIDWLTDRLIIIMPHQLNSSKFEGKKRARTKKRKKYLGPAEIARPVAELFGGPRSLRKPEEVIYVLIGILLQYQRLMLNKTIEQQHKSNYDSKTNEKRDEHPFGLHQRGRDLIGAKHRGKMFYYSIQKI
jgi:hypothetical protein